MSKKLKEALKIGLAYAWFMTLLILFCLTLVVEQISLSGGSEIDTSLYWSILGAGSITYPNLLYIMYRNSRGYRRLKRQIGYIKWKRFFRELESPILEDLAELIGQNTLFHYDYYEIGIIELKDLEDITAKDLLVRMYNLDRKKEEWFTK